MQRLYCISRLASVNDRLQSGSKFFVSETFPFKECKMGAAINLSVRRDDATDITLVPVSGTYEKGIQSIVYRELSTTKPEGACIRLTLTSEEMKSGVKKLTRKLEVPIMAIIPAGSVNSDGRTAAPAVDHVETDIRVRYHHPNSTATERADSLRLGSHIDIGATTTAGGGVGPASTTPYAFRDIPSANQVPYGDINYVWPNA